MTTNQLQYWANQETIRANQAREVENNRSNVAREVETNRSNLANESLKDMANRIARANKVDELQLTRAIQSRSLAIQAANSLNQQQANEIAAQRVNNELQLGNDLNAIKTKTNEINSAAQSTAEGRLDLDKDKFQVDKKLSEIKGTAAGVGALSTALSMGINVAKLFG